MPLMPPPAPESSSRRTEVKNKSKNPEWFASEGSGAAPTYGACEMEFKPIPLLDDVASKVPFYVPSETSEMRIDVAEDPEVFWERLSDGVDGHLLGWARRLRARLQLRLRAGLSEGGGDPAGPRRRVHGPHDQLALQWRPHRLRARPGRSRWSVSYLVDLLERLSVASERQNLHVLSHSLGSRGVMLALESLRRISPHRRSSAAGCFWLPISIPRPSSSTVSRLAPMVESITLYASRHDTPLKVSRRLTRVASSGRGWRVPHSSRRDGNDRRFARRPLPDPGPRVLLLPSTGRVGPRAAPEHGAECRRPAGLASEILEWPDLLGGG